MAVICNTCGLPDDLCACGDLDKDSTHIIIRLETRRFRKKGTMIEGLDPKINNLGNVARELKNKYACGGTAKDGYVFLQGDHRDTIKDTLVKLGCCGNNRITLKKSVVTKQNFASTSNTAYCFNNSNFLFNDIIISSWCVSGF